jgi:hypothetical protein
MWCATYKDRFVMKWNQQQHTKTITIDPSKGNVATMWTSDHNSKFKQLYQLVKDQSYLQKSEVSEVPNQDEEIYQDQNNWECIKMVEHTGDGLLNIEGTDNVQNA